MASQSKCATQLAAGLTCQPNPCCAADVSGNNRLEVGDVFQFLSLWFAGCP